MGWIIAIVFVYIPLMFGVYHLAKRYGRGCRSWVLGSLFISPIICIIVLSCLGKATEKIEEDIKQQQRKDIIILLISAFLTCGLYALLTIMKIINDETVKNSIFAISFIVFVFFLQFCL